MSQEEGLHQKLAMLAPSEVSCLQSCEEIEPCCLSHTVYGILLRQSTLTETEGTHIIKDNKAEGKSYQSQKEGWGSREDGEMKPD